MLQPPIITPQTDSFMEAHPLEDGWKVYECGDPVVIHGHQRYLLDCLKDLHPEALKRRVALKDATNTLLEYLEKPASSEHGNDLNSDLDSEGWTGLVEIEWKGQPIHFYSYVIFGGMEPREVNLVATKSNRALLEFLAVVESYGRSRLQPKERKILVVNGRDIPTPKVAWDDVLLPSTLKNDIRTNVDGFFKSRERYQRLGIPYRRGFLFAGPPGNGKTLTLKAMANSIEATFITVLTRARADERDIEYAFHLANKNAPAVLLFEDLDKLVKHGSEHLSLSYFLNILDGLKVMDGVLVIATSNEPGKLDPALLHRPSRFDRVWKFLLPQYEERLALLERKGASFFSASALDEAAQNSNGFSMAYVQEIIVNALLECAHEDIAPNDAHLLKSVETLCRQRKSASKPDEDLAERESLGFSPQPRFGLRELLHPPDEDEDE